jgi:hypothetical protein
MKIIVGGVISLQPFSAGNAWDRLHYAIGLQQLGHEVLFLEEIEPEWCVDREGRRVPLEQSVNRKVFRELMRRFQLESHACQIYDGGRAIEGMSRPALISWAGEADLLLNISGHVRSEDVLANVRRRAYLDQDPVFTQLWRAAYGKSLGLERHDVFLTVGLNIGTARSPIPDCGLPWRHTLPPVVLGCWPDRGARGGTARSARFTTIASWSGFKDVSYGGEWYQSKYVEFARFAELPRRAAGEFQVALKDFREQDDGIRLLRENGWILSRAGAIADLDRYREFISASDAEIGIAQNAYVKGRSGWFSDRTAQYLASGRPALLESTGFERELPTGEGVLTFNTMEEAVAGVEAIDRGYERHGRAAREFALEYLDSARVLPRMLELCDASREEIACPR